MVAIDPSFLDVETFWGNKGSPKEKAEWANKGGAWRLGRLCARVKGLWGRVLAFVPACMQPISADVETWKNHKDRGGTYLARCLRTCILEAVLGSRI